MHASHTAPKMSGRTPHGVRGLKCRGLHGARVEAGSHPSRGAWIEIRTGPRKSTAPNWSHPSRGAWIEIRSRWPDAPQPCRRTPHGVRGLKYLAAAQEASNPLSHPSRGAWIEIRFWRRASRSRARRTPHGVRGLKSRPYNSNRRNAQSHPSRGAWIEISGARACERGGTVAPLTGCVD